MPSTTTLKKTFSRNNYVFQTVKFIFINKIFTFIIKKSIKENKLLIIF